MRIGVDFGTTHTGGAYYDGSAIKFIPLDAANREPHLLRSMIYITRDQTSRLGLDAVKTYLEQDTGRFTRYEEKVVGTVENTVARLGRGPTDPDGPIQIIYDVVVAEDVGAQGRLIQSIKTGLRDESYAGTNIFGRFYTIQELIALLLRHVKRQAEAHLDVPVTRVALGRPVAFSANPAVDRIAEARLRESALLAGFQDVTFELEPVAAALFYTHHLTRSERILVFDFGGGTLDLTVMHTNPYGEPAILGTHGVLVGGDDIDSALMRHRVSHFFGTTASINESGAPFPAELANLLERWQTIPQLTRPQNFTVIHKARERGSAPAAFAALEALVQNNYGFALFNRIEEAKRTLSHYETANIKLKEKDIDVDIELTRRELPLFINREIARVQRGLNEVLVKADLAPDEIDVVVSTGGSSLIPIFQTILERKFRQAQIVRSDTFGSVTAGLALRARE